MKHRSALIRILLLSGILLAARISTAQKTDRIMVQNGDWITGEVKQLDMGMLSYKTDAAGTISVKWEQVRHMMSEKLLVLRLSSGDFYSGSLEPTENSFEVRILGEVDTVINLNYVVEINPIKGRFWKRLDGSVDFGFSFTKASQVKQTNLNFNVEHRGRNALTMLSSSLINTANPEENLGRRFDSNFRHRYYFRHNFAAENFLLLQRNTELDLGLRAAYGLGVSKNWIRSNVQRFYSGIGPLINAETSISQYGYTTSLETFIYLEHRVYKYRDPEVYITTTYAVYPSLSDPGRLRWDLQSQLRLEVLKDFFVGFTFYHTYDNRPVSEEGSTNDWGFTTSLGYSF
jgi:hypothetical protein